MNRATILYYASTNRGFIKAAGEFTANIRLAYPFTSFEMAELIVKEEIAKGTCRNYYAILQMAVAPSSNSNAEGIRGTTEHPSLPLASPLQSADVTRTAAQLGIACHALNFIASWEEGAEVGPHFDEPAAARRARRALLAVDSLK